MDFIIDAIVEWLKGLLVDGIMGNLDGLFDNVNQSVGEIATQVGTTPADWNAGVFSMIPSTSRPFSHSTIASMIKSIHQLRFWKRDNG